MLENKIDFFVVVSVKDANPNGDPLNGNRPREDFEGFGEISDVCLKRKIRNRLQDAGESIFVQSDDRAQDGYSSLKERADKELKEAGKDKEKYAKLACEKWIDVRSFGQVFAFKDAKKKEEGGEVDKGVSIGIRGPVSIHPALSVSPVDIISLQITKSVNSEPTKDGTKSSDTMGMKHRVRFGVYTFAGSINCQLAEKTGFGSGDAQKIHDAICTLFENDTSSARPEGSMAVEKVYWWTHNSKNGQYPSIKVHKQVDVKLKEDVEIPKSMKDYEITYQPLPDLETEIYEL